MIKSLVCFHTTADLDMLSESEWISGGISGIIDTNHIKKAFNCYDESALELTCRFLDICTKNDIECETAAVTVGEERDRRFLEYLAAIGYSKTDIINIEEETRRTLTAETLSSLLFSYIREENIQSQHDFNCIICGEKSADGYQGKTPLLLAELLGLRCITGVMSFCPNDENSLTVTYQRDDCICTETVQTPLLLVIGNSADTYLRVPTLKARMQSKHQSIGLYTAGDLLADSNQCVNQSVKMCEMQADIPLRNGTLINDGDPAEQAVVMYSYYKKWVKL